MSRPPHSPKNPVRELSQRLLRPARSAMEEIEERLRVILFSRNRDSKRRRLLEKWLRTLHLLHPLGTFTHGNRITPLLDGDDAFEAMWEAISLAERRVLCSTYTLQDDAVGRRLARGLAAAAARGCEVVLQVDGFGSSALPASFLGDLEQAGVRVFVFNPPLRLWARMSRLVRNHRKILVVDDDVGFCGGMNISVDYAGLRHGSGRFRDVHVRVEGPSVEELVRLVRAAVRECGGRIDRGRTPSEVSEPGSLVQILESNRRHEKRAIQKAMRLTLKRAVERCQLTSPYFVPPRRLMRDLERAVERGIEVQVVTAGRSDVPLVRRASRHLQGRLLRAGVRIWEMQKRTLHAKTATIDGIYASVGSFNLDYWSYRRNLEVTLCAFDEKLAHEIEERFEEDLHLSEEVRLETWGKRGLFERIRDWIAYQLMRL